MDYLFYINDIPIEEPTGWEDFELSMKRDDKTHGIQFEASTGTLKFYGAAAEYLKQQKELYSIKANVVFVAQEFCSQPYEPIEEITGRLNFGKYKGSCGDECIVEIPLEEDSCRVIFKNKYDQKIDIDKLIALDGVTNLANYNAMGIDLDLKAKAFDVRAEGFVSLDSDSSATATNESLLSGYVHFRPIYAREIFNSIQTGQIASVAVNLATNQAFGGPPPSPQILFEDNVSCFSGEAEYEIRLKGSFTIVNGNNDFLWAKLRWLEWLPVDNGDTLGPNATVIQEFDIFPPTGPGGYPVPNYSPYDQTFTGTIELKQDHGYYAVLEVAVLPGDWTIQNTFEPETYFRVSTTKECPDTQVKSYLIHETLSRVAESITSNCMRVKSNYYGRIDSQPFAFDSDGCGGLRMLTSGLKIRRAPNDSFFASLKDLFEGLNAIDNIGFDISTDPNINSRFILNIEAVDYFYRDEEIFLIEAIPHGDEEIQEQMHFSKINVGYKKWQVEKINGLDEFNSTREYSTSFDTISNTLDITSALITGSYPIEYTRQQSFADSGAADTKFDDDTFLITLKRNAYDFEVEQDNVANAANFFDPDTIYNYRLSPLHNLMRWYKTIAAGYKILNDSNNKLFFNAGTGNFLAQGEVITGAYDSACKLEAQTIKENQNLFVTHFARAQDYTPLWKNELFTFEYPLNVSEYKNIKTNPYGYISYQCGNGSFEKGFIKEIKFKPAKGKATFTLLKKRD
jgi:hypothetical protein